MASYNDIKSASDTSLREKEIEAVRINKINKDKFKIAFNLSNAPVVAELSKIGNTFLGGRFLLKPGYRVRGYKCEKSIINWNGDIEYFWELEHQIKNGTNYYYHSLRVKLGPVYPQTFSVQCTSSYLDGPSIEREQGVEVVKRFCVFLGIVNSKIQASYMNL